MAVYLLPVLLCRGLLCQACFALWLRFLHGVDTAERFEHLEAQRAEAPGDEEHHKLQRQLDCIPPRAGRHQLCQPKGEEKDLPDRHHKAKAEATPAPHALHQVAEGHHHHRVEDIDDGQYPEEPILWELCHPKDCQVGIE
eukprot:CAMPEP_0117695274 /NCGR_PEP_ID=MMETSP0804-20121206/28056_1 /TAXON_ID=1074897 /ORGANISM="Tetraselmis astigmatica, Strain CCMP880" /LENGTH=139 /DNA_ID=CAMNT_0005509343 /DNA_START=26 /DNA_END=443 /DNA_ORIENTATION=-